MLCRQTAELDGPSLDARYLGPAEVVAVRETHVCIALGVQQQDARLAVPNYRPQSGDQVLALGDRQSGYYVIGVLQAVEPEQVRKVDPTSSTGCTRIEIEEGDLELVTRRGNIRLVSAGGIELTALAPIDVRSRTAVRMSIFGRVGQLLSKLNLFDRTAELSSESIEVTSESLRARTRQAAVEANRLDARFDATRVTSRRIELVTDTILSRAKNVYQHVSELWQLTAGRSRMVVDGTSHHKANRIYSKAVKDVKIDGEKIHLG